MIFEQIKVSNRDNFCYVIGDEISKEAAVVDVAGAITEILRFLDKHKLKLAYIISTHGHSDHTTGNPQLASFTRAKIAAHVSTHAQKDIALSDGASLAIGQVQLRLLHTPGHTPDSICVLANGKLMTGDTLFVGECGRTDLPGGSSEQMYSSLFEKISKLGDDIEIYPGHDYGSKRSSTIAFEKKNNYTLQPRTKAQFIEFMAQP